MGLLKAIISILPMEKNVNKNSPVGNDLAYSNPSIFSSAEAMILSNKSGKVIPPASAAFGNKLCSVSPGMVLISSTKIIPRGSTIISVRENPFAPIALCAEIAVR